MDTVRQFGRIAVVLLACLGVLELYLAADPHLVDTLRDKQVEYWQFDEEPPLANADFQTAFGLLFGAVVVAMLMHQPDKVVTIDASGKVVGKEDGVVLVKKKEK